MESIKLIEIKSEIAAGTRGASLGIDALKTACLDLGSDYFARYDSEEVDNVNEILFEGVEHPTAKFIPGVFTMENRVCEMIATNMQQGHFPIVLAGDHSTAAGTICGIKKANPTKRLGVIWIDAHADLHTPFTTPSGNMHGMPLAIVSAIDNLECQINQPKEETKEYWEKLKNIGISGPKILLEDIVFIALRDTEEPENLLVAKHNILCFKPQDMRNIGVEATVAKTLERLKDCDMIYISFDVDSMDSTISEGTGTPVPNGITNIEARELNEMLISDPKVVAWEMVEVNPTLDNQNKMAEVAFEILEATTNSLLSRNGITKEIAS
jgi:arginase